MRARHVQIHNWDCGAVCLFDIINPELQDQAAYAEWLDKTFGHDPDRPGITPEEASRVLFELGLPHHVVNCQEPTHEPGVTRTYSVEDLRRMVNDEEATPIPLMAAISEKDAETGHWVIFFNRCIIDPRLDQKYAKIANSGQPVVMHFAILFKS